MKKIGLICVTVLAGFSLSACNNLYSRESNKTSDSTTTTTTTKVLKHHKTKAKQNKKKESSSSSSAYSSSSNANNQQVLQKDNQQQATVSQSQHDNGVNNAQAAVNAARAKYGDDNGSVHWNYMIDGETGQPIRNADGSYFVKGTDGQTMSGTRYSVNVYPDGSMTSN